MTDVILYGLPFSTYVRTARLILAAKGVDHRLQTVNFRSDDYLALHPFRRMPVLDHGTVRLYETLAIGSYVDEAFEGPKLTPATAAGKAQMLQWISAVGDYVYGIVVRDCVMERFVKPMRGLAPDEDKIAAALPAIRDCLQVFDKQLRSTPYLAGETLSMADLFLAPILAYFAATPEGAKVLPDLPGLSMWFDRVRSTPSWADIAAVE
jgi:glutathione S-transferase